MHPPCSEASPNSQRIRPYAILCDAGRSGCASDNAAAESFFSTLEHELTSRCRYNYMACSNSKRDANVDANNNPESDTKEPSSKTTVVNPHSFDSVDRPALPASIPTHLRYDLSGRSATFHPSRFVLVSLRRRCRVFRTKTRRWS